ncbi:hypothetical protein I5Q34_06150 [Streptomyces sp. AV19]|uniref:hypothetical protein n=1 Tax=Streptomyces sp. AV19 TaxID=2793068 RepID=UPI001A2B2172|nr:hypothetical protein [Streptomyces sp. AV19]MBH1933880.1 hypothetical protein [Streptomyces sp. AV19]MDG4535632.1 hypothetical protein [Streptomyces sp. AV19]
MDIGRAAAHMAQRSRRAVDLLKGLRLYERPDGGEHHRAAVVAELFRDGRAVANAGHLDVRTLQGTVLRALRESDSLEFELGWGQAKRSAGGWKTEGPDADLAELVALARLAAVVRAARLLTGRPVTLRIVPGGRRFSEALFTRPEADDAYNERRAAMVGQLGQRGLITVAREASVSPGDLRARLAEAKSAQGTPRSPSPSELRFALFAIDWEHVLDRAGPPHGLPVPTALGAAWKRLPGPGRALLLRQLVAALVRGDAPGDRGSAEAVRWMAAVCRESAVAYALLGRITRRDGAAARGCVLTVVEKRDRPDVPVLTLLGRRHGNHLPQNVVALVTRDGVRFVPRVLVPEGARLVLAPGPGPRGRPLPFFFTDLPAEDAARALHDTDILDLS